MKLSFAFALAVATVVSAPEAARAEEPVHDASSDSDLAPRRVDVGFRFGAGASNRAGFVLSGAALSYRVLPNLALGAYADKTLTTLAMSQDGCDTSAGCSDKGFFRAGARAEGHVLTDFVIDPWLAGAAGARVVEGSARFEPLLEAGVDFRPSSSFALGAFVSFAPNLGSEASYAGNTLLGLRFSASFGDRAPARDVARAGHSADVE